MYTSLAGCVRGRAAVAGGGGTTSEPARCHQGGNRRIRRGLQEDEGHGRPRHPGSDRPTVSDYGSMPMMIRWIISRGIIEIPSVGKHSVSQSRSETWTQ